VVRALLSAAQAHALQNQMASTGEELLWMEKVLAEDQQEGVQGAD